LVFTDIEGSTRLLEQLGVEAYGAALAEHRRIVRDACARHDGYEVDYEGDAFFYAFASAQSAVGAVSEAMTGLESGPIRIRVGIHTGEPALDPPKYVGLDVHRAARIMAAAHGGQVVLSPSTVALLEPGTVELTDLGEHRLKDLTRPVRLHQLAVDALPRNFPPLKTLYRSNLPVPATPFLGREHELAEIVERLTHPDTRLLTLTGPGGTGKTRLALQAAAQASEHYPDGITWIPLAPLRDPALLIPTIAQALGIREQPGESLAETVTQALSGKRSLLLVDNVEHVLPEAAHLLAGLIDSCPNLNLLVTSRERLLLTVETSWPVPTLADADGTELFTQRARAVRPDFEPTSEVGAICAALDRLPLAIELAAARTRSLSPAAILARLDQRIPLLASRARDVEERQRTLEATIAWSYDLLDADEQRALRALSVFAGGCTLDAARDVAGAELDLLESLLDKSLLRHRTDGAGDRYWMLETIREYADDRLTEAQETDAVFEAFVEWMAGIVGEVDEPWIERDQLEWLRTLERERANLMHAITTCLVQGQPERALQLVAAADQFIDARGPIALFAEMLDGLRCGAPGVDGRVVLLRIRLLLRMGRFTEVRAAVDASAAAFSADPCLAARLLSLRSFNLLYVGDPEAAAAFAAQSVERARAVGDRRGLADALVSLGVARTTLGEIETGLTHLRESQRVSESLGDARNVETARSNLAITLLADRRPSEACALLRDVLQTVRLIDDPVFLSTTLVNIAIGLSAIGETTGARAALREAIELELVQFDESVRREGLLVLAIAATHEAAPERAITLWGAGARLGETVGYVVGPELQVYVSDRLEPLRGLPDFDRHWERGRSLSADEAIELGLGQAPHSGQNVGERRSAV
jgi:predicted ATPase